jgi:predicted peroxiredoxin
MPWGQDTTMGSARGLFRVLQRSIDGPRGGAEPCDRASGITLCRMASGALVVKATAGKNDPERCNQAFTVAATAVASGVPVSLWLTGEATLLALPGQADDFRLPYATPLGELLETILKSGSVTVCTQCAARREITEDDLVEGVRIAGAATFVAEVLADGAKALVY